MSYAQNMDDFDDLEPELRIRNVPGREQHGRQPKAPGRPPKPDQVIAEQIDSQESFNFSYHASRHERGWIVDSLGGFYEGQWLEDVLRLIKGGKEANVYQCQSGVAMEDAGGARPPYLAAKVYRPRRFRNLKNDFLYREGRQHLDNEGRLVTNDGMLHAIQKRTEYGLGLLHTSWIEHEFKTMQVLYAAGCDVPAPLTSGNNAILMGYIGDEEMPAPTLNSIDLGRKEARQLFERVVHNIDLMLAHQRVHADLSAFNILYWEGEITLIDFPQAIHPDENRNAFRIFERDVLRVCEYFISQGVRVQARKLAADLWKAHQRHMVPDVHPGLLDAEDEKDRVYWKRWMDAEL
jgi:RIO kinase 1